MTTLAPVCARLMAVLTAVVVLPSPGRLEVTSKVFGARPAVESRTEVLSWRYASASADRPLMFRSNSGLAPLLPFRFCREVADDSKRRGAEAELIAGITASAGNRRNLSTSSVEWTVSSRYSRNSASAAPNASANTNTNITVRKRAGPTGKSGTIA